MTRLLALVLVGHLLGDWVVQTDWQAANKTRSWRALAQHVGTYHVVLALAVLPVFWTWKALVLLGVSAATHAFLDRRWPVVRLLRATGSPYFADQMWGVLCADQALHISILLALVAVLG